MIVTSSTRRGENGGTAARADSGPVWVASPTRVQVTLSESHSETASMSPAAQLTANSPTMPMRGALPQSVGSLISTWPLLDVEAELDNVTVAHHVVLPLHAGLALRARLRDRAGRDEVLERDDLGLDEALLKVGVNDT